MARFGANVWIDKGNSFMEKYEGAIACYDKALAIDPNYVNTWILKGLSYIYRDIIKPQNASYKHT